MTTEEIIRMAKEADLWGEIYAMQRFANLVAAAEREACAKVCEAIADDAAKEQDFHTIGACELCADEIRARGEA